MGRLIDEDLEAWKEETLKQSSRSFDIRISMLFKMSFDYWLSVEAEDSKLMTTQTAHRFYQCNYLNLWKDNKTRSDVTTGLEGRGAR